MAFPVTEPPSTPKAGGGRHPGAGATPEGMRSICVKLQRHAAALSPAAAGAAQRRAGRRDRARRRARRHRLPQPRRGRAARRAAIAVNPKHRTVFGKRAYARLTRSAASRPTSRWCVTPARAVASVIADAGGRRREGGGGPDQRLRRNRRRRAARCRTRCSPRRGAAACASSARTASASCAPTPASTPPSRARRRAPASSRWSRSRARSAARSSTGRASAEVGFTSVVSLGGAIDVDFGEVLDFLVADEATDAILMYVEGIRDARRYLSALRAAARVKPVVALKVGRYAGGSRAASSHTGALVGSDAVFDAALRRAGSVRVKTYTQLFAAARVLATGRLPGRRAPGDRHQRRRPGRGRRRQRGRERRRRWQRCLRKPSQRLNQDLPPQWSHGNPLDIIGDAPAERFGAATRGGARRSRRGRAARDVLAGRGDRARGGGARSRRRRARQPQAGARRVARRHQPEREPRACSSRTASRTSTRRRTRSRRSRSCARTGATRRC